MIRLILLVALALATSAHAARGGCNQLFSHHKQAVVVQQVVAVPQIYYSVGEAVQIEAAVEKAFLRREQRLQQLQHAPQQIQGEQGGNKGGTSVFSARCLRCHSGEAAKGAVRLDGFVDTATRWRITELLSGHAVPDAMKGVIGSLQPGDHPAILQELMQQKPAKPPEAPPMPVEEPGVLR